MRFAFHSAAAHSLQPVGPHPSVLPGKITPIKPIPTNTRAAAAEAMEKAKDEEPWFGIEQARDAGAGGGTAVDTSS